MNDLILPAHLSHCHLCSQFPARLNPETTAKLLGFQKEDIPILIRANLLKPLAKPKPNAIKYFARQEILSLGNDLKWLSKATQAIYSHWQEKQAKGRGGDGVACCAARSSSSLVRFIPADKTVAA